MATSLSTVGPPSCTRFLWPIRAHDPNGISICSAIYAQMTAKCTYTLQWDAPFPPQNCPFPWGDLNTQYMVPWAHPSPQPNGISIGAAVFAGLTSVTDRRTDHTTRSVTIGRIYLRSTVMWPNNINKKNLTAEFCTFIPFLKESSSPS